MQVLEPPDLNDHMPIFDHHHPKIIIKLLLAFLNFYQHTKNQLIPLIPWDKSQFLCPETRVATPIFDQAHSNIFQSTYSFHEFVSTCKSIRFFCHFVLEIWSIFKNCNLCGQEHFGCYLRNKIFPKYGIRARIQQIL